MFASNPAVLEELLDALFHIAKADKVMHPSELDYLKSVAEIFDFSETEFERIRAGHLGADAADPYMVLGVAHNADEAEIRTAWRKLIRENHPDSLIAQGMPQDFIDVANDKMAAINGAWDTVQRQRGIK
jgi:DnaJ like chaperone protein